MNQDLLKKLGGVRGFEWDAGNSVKNVRKHQVSCEEAEQVFFNRPLLFMDDPAHSVQENRFKAFGISHHARYLTISFTLRAGLIRIISARPMNRREKIHYEKQG